MDLVRDKLSFRKKKEFDAVSSQSAATSFKERQQMAARQQSQALNLPVAKASSNPTLWKAAERVSKSSFHKHDARLLTSNFQPGSNWITKLQKEINPEICRGWTKGKKANVIEKPNETATPNISRYTGTSRAPAKTANVADKKNKVTKQSINGYTSTSRAREIKSNTTDKAKVATPSINKGTVTSRAKVSKTNGAAGAVIPLMMPRAPRARHQATQTGHKEDRMELDIDDDEVEAGPSPGPGYVWVHETIVHEYRRKGLDAQQITKEKKPKAEQEATELLLKYFLDLLQSPIQFYKCHGRLEKEDSQNQIASRPSGNVFWQNFKKSRKTEFYKNKVDTIQSSDITMNLQARFTADSDQKENELKLKSLEKEKNKLKRKNKEKRRRITSLREKLSALKLERSHESPELQDENGHLPQKVAKLYLENRCLRTEIAEIENLRAHEQPETENNSRGRDDELEQRFGELRLENRYLDADLFEANKELQALKEEKSSQAAKFRENISELTRIAKAVHDEKAKLKTELSQVMEECRDLARIIAPFIENRVMISILEGRRAGEHETICVPLAPHASSRYHVTRLRYLDCYIHIFSTPFAFKWNPNLREVAREEQAGPRHSEGRGNQGLEDEDLSSTLVRRLNESQFVREDESNNEPGEGVTSRGALRRARTSGENGGMLTEDSVESDMPRLVISHMIMIDNLNIPHFQTTGTTEQPRKAITRLRVLKSAQVDLKILDETKRDLIDQAEDWKYRARTYAVKEEIALTESSKWEEYAMTWQRKYKRLRERVISDGLESVQPPGKGRKTYTNRVQKSPVMINKQVNARKTIAKMRWKKGLPSWVRKYLFANSTAPTAQLGLSRVSIHNHSPRKSLLFHLETSLCSFT
ncbi:hypothetical protein G7Y89_g13636 [Cudoniella acicularis]|uniref:Uncharacterized protein n=1 Tax=Cudoniella acicularis TaxID=354080 RepID=A0A8H4RAA2_9HELO|nr:hypothetical protein G7Y89_g13636 [Cudoniella acicularis]